jgi:hypothetical protein
MSTYEWQCAKLSESFHSKYSASLLRNGEVHLFERRDKLLCDATMMALDATDAHMKSDKLYLKGCAWARTEGSRSTSDATVMNNEDDDRVAEFVVLSRSLMA